LRYNNFENFVRRNERIVRMSSGTLNLLERSIINPDFGILIVPPSSLSEPEIDSHIKRINHLNPNSNIIVLTYHAIKDLPDLLRERYAVLSHNIFSLADVTNDPFLKMTLLDYLIESRRVKRFLVGSAIFGPENTAQMFELYDRL
jgi:hypothetical protein